MGITQYTQNKLEQRFLECERRIFTLNLYLLICNRHKYKKKAPKEIDIMNELTFVFDAGRPNSNFLFLCGGHLFPPVARRLCQLSRDIPITNKLEKPENDKNKNSSFFSDWAAS